MTLKKFSWGDKVRAMSPEKRFENIPKYKINDRFYIKVENKYLKDAYPFIPQSVEVLVLGNYDYFYTVQVLPHKNREDGLGLSIPYTISLNKEDIKLGLIEISDEPFEDFKNNYLMELEEELG